LKLLKLHGSINWRRRKDSGAIAFYPIEAWLSEVHTRLVEPDQNFLTLGVETHIAPLLKNRMKVELEETPVIVPPGLFKNEYQGSISAVWQQAARELEEAQEISVIGYSLPETDFFFRNLFAFGTVGRKFIRRFSVVNPDQSGKTEERFKIPARPGDPRTIQIFEVHVCRDHPRNVEVLQRPTGDSKSLRFQRIDRSTLLIQNGGGRRRLPAGGL
jgi:hypothetical protein